MSRGAEQKSPVWLVLGVLAPALLVNLWKLLGRGYAFYEIWGHLALDIAVVVLLIAVIVVNPFEHPVVYAIIYALFCAAYLGNYWPATVLEWLGTAVALGLLGVFVFPRLVALTPWVSLGLLLAYTLVLRTYLPELNRDEAMEVLKTKDAGKTAAGFLHDVFNYERNLLGREKYRYYVEGKSGYVDRLKSVGRLHSHVYPALKKQGISFLYWRELYLKATPSGDMIVARYQGGIVEGVMEAKDEAGYRLACTAVIDPFEIGLVRAEDGGYRVLLVPDSIGVTLKETLPPKPIR